MHSRKNGPSILIVDDDVLACEALRLRLVQAQMNVVGIVHNGLDAVDLVRGLSPDIVLWDDTMQDMDGVSALKRIQEIRPGLPLMIMTGRGTPARAANALAEGAFAVIDKTTIDLRRLPDMIRVLARGSGAIVEAGLLRELILNASSFHPHRDVELSPVVHAAQSSEELSLREFGILQLFVNNYRDEEIAAELSLDIGTVRDDLARICLKLHVEDDSSLEIVAARLGLLDEW